jgi:MFS family permease
MAFGWLVSSYALYNLFTGHFYLALASSVVITFGEMFSMPFMNSYWISRSSEHNRGQYAALYTIGWGTAQVAAPSIGGFIADRYSYTSLWWIVFLITIIAVLVTADLLHLLKLLRTNVCKIAKQSYLCSESFIFLS